jgi:hypothetical protein
VNLSEPLEQATAAIYWEMTDLALTSANKEFANVSSPPIGISQGF